MKTAVKKPKTTKFSKLSFAGKEITKLLPSLKKKIPKKDSDKYNLNERVKELSVLYGVSQILVDEQSSIEKILEKIVLILPHGWQYPEITAAQITIGEKEFKTKNFIPSKQKLFCKFYTVEKIKCCVEVVYLKDMPDEYQGPFLMEERKLLDMVARMLKVYLAHRNVESERCKITDHLIQRNKALEEFAFIVSHNIRAPVANIIGLSEILCDERLSEKDKHEFIKNLHQSIKVFDDTIKHLNSVLQSNKF